ncbi:hypothetical protein [Streptomyces halobius]|uniref:Uncharacterized protein n=1 Tax=Streptomyces halobius TaxID=2879846 RepID=A0ABY4M388_9ACTN|nr:hypothetical protein [Streptomyces halobius]UQA92217.1 hypothetical protein K9S39_10560 [Streptomyces halobius]
MRIGFTTPQGALIKRPRGRVRTSPLPAYGLKGAVLQRSHRIVATLTTALLALGSIVLAAPAHAAEIHTGLGPTVGAFVHTLATLGIYL